MWGICGGSCVGNCVGGLCMWGICRGSCVGELWGGGGNCVGGGACMGSCVGGLCGEPLPSVGPAQWGYPTTLSPTAPRPAIQALLADFFLYICATAAEELPPPPSLAELANPLAELDISLSSFLTDYWLTALLALVCLVFGLTSQLNSQWCPLIDYNSTDQ